MPRVTDTEVFDIIETDLTDINAFITAANVIVTNRLDGDGLDDATLKEVERYVAAHIVCCRDPRAKEEQIDVASKKYTGTFGIGLKATSYGQTAMLLDTTGNLASLADNLYRKQGTITTLGYHE